MLKDRLQPLADRTRALGPAQLHSFCRNGYLIVDALFDRPALVELRRQYEIVCQQTQASGKFNNFADKSAAGSEAHVVMTVNQVCERSIFFHQLLYDARILDIVEDLMGSNIQLFHDFLLRKPARCGGAVFWHQDNQAWQSMPPNNITCWIALDDADAQNGALHYIPGSHRQTLGLEIDAEGRLQDIDALVAQSEVDIAEVKAGGAVFHHCLTLHHSAPNKTERIRRAHSIIFMQVGTRCGRKPPFNSRPTGEGDHFGTSFGHPVLRTASLL
jgi:ectoine hydroxylase-related dioxygenase (phytanoyl-CoA dioxygenase family)